MPALLGERDEVGLHLRPGREVGASRPSGPAGAPGLPGRRPAGCSSRSARRRAIPRATGACGLVHDSSRWKNGQRRNIPPGDGSAEMTAWSTPRRAQRVRDLERAGSAADDDDRVVARREGRVARSAPPSVRRAQPARLGLEHPVHDPRMGDQEGLDARAGAGRRQRSGLVATTSAIGDSPRMIETSPKNSPRPSRARSVPSTTIAASPSRMT